MMNMSLEPVTIPKNLKLGELMFCSPSTVLLASMENVPDKDYAVSGVQEFGDGPDCGPQKPNRLLDREFLNLFKLSNDVTSEQMASLKQLLIANREIFSVHKYDVGNFQGVQHSIHTTGPPIRQPLRRQSPIARDEANKIIKEMLEHNIIKPSSSPWSSPIVLVRKSDGSTRFCVDYRLVNDATYKDSYPLPRIDDTLDSLGGSVF